MTGPRIGSLFSGYGGLDLAVESVLGGTTAWVSDIDKGACAILDHRFPDVPNVGDITAVDWAAVEPVDVITGGSPCQDLSHAGKRAGMTEGTRSNLWVAMREAIAAIRPSLVIWENVRGALSAAADSGLVDDGRLLGPPAKKGRQQPGLRALGRVLGDLADLGYDAGWLGVRASDVGAPHQRFRVFVVAHPQGDPWWFGHGNSAAAADAGGQAGIVGAGLREGEPSGVGRGQPARSCGSTGLTLPSAAVRLIPTPLNSDAGPRGGTTGYGLRSWSRAHAKGEHGNALLLLPSPKARDYKGTGPAGAERHSPDLSEIPRLLPTPMTDPDSHNGHARDLGSEAQLLQTPSVSDATGGHQTRGGARSDELLLNGQAQAMHGQQWGDYAEAVARWEQLTRPAPAPTMTSTKGNPQLAPAFVEWLMGLPQGWVTDVPDLTRNQMLKALGNGVVPQQAAYAVGHLLQALSATHAQEASA